MTARWRRDLAVKEAREEARREIESLKRSFELACKSRDEWRDRAFALDREYRELVEKTYPPYPSAPFFRNNAASASQP